MRSLLIGFCALLATGSAAAASYQLQPDGSGDFPTLQAALDALAGGEPDTLWLADGVFAGPGNRELYAVNFAGFIASMSGDPERCTLDFGGQEVGQAFFGEFRFADLRFTGQSLELRAYATALSFSGCIFEDGGTIASSPDEWSPVVLTDCTIRRLTGSVVTSVSLIRLLRCHFEDNSTDYDLFSGYHLECRECSFVGNRVGDALLRVIGIEELPGQLLVEDCAFLGNAATCVALEDLGTGSVQGCSFVGNGGSEEADIRDSEDFGAHSLAIERCIFAYRESGDVLLRGAYGSTLTVACCDVFGNAGGDWVGDLAPFGGIDGNLSTDPRFCEWPSGDLTLAASSPCLPENNSCGVQIGAEGQGCADPTAAEAAPGGELRLAAQPNPFNPKTRLSFALPQAARVDLVVFDTAGRRVATLLDGAPRLGGAQSVDWDARSLPSGVYLARLSAPQLHAEVKLSLLR